MQRRSFIKLLGMTGAAAAAGVVVANRDTFDAVPDNGAFRVSYSRRAIGTRVDITAIGRGRAQTEDAVAAAFEDVAGMERVFTRFDDRSPVCEANALGRLEYVPEELAALLDACDAYYRDTEGAFDITVKPLIDLMQLASRDGRRPTSAEIEEAMKAVGADGVRIEGGRLVMRENTAITLDGAAPGFIADRASHVLRRYGINNFMVNAGGEIRVSGHPQKSESWRIAIQDPQKSGNFPGILALNEGAVSTSGNYEVFYGEDRLYHHIVDAKTGRSPAMASVTVTAPTALQADILSTALFVMSPARALAYCGSHPGVECLLIDNDGNRTVSPGFRMV